MCGEKATARCSVTGSKGSPPRVRGKALDALVRHHAGGITPACAGKSSRPTAFCARCRDHPRVCGEKYFALIHSESFGGSPPRVRGKVAGVCACNVVQRITPACAGKRLKRSRSTVPHAAIVPLFPSVCNKPAGSDGSPAGHDAPPFLPLENAAPASPAYNLRSL